MSVTILRRLHLAGAILFVLTGIAHLIGQYAPSAPDVVVDGVMAMMARTHLAGSGFSLRDIMMCWGALYGVMSLLFGVNALTTVHAARGDIAVVRASARTAALAGVLQGIVSLAYHTPPPAVFMLPAAMIMGLAGFAKVRDQPGR